MEDAGQEAEISRRDKDDSCSEQMLHTCSFHYFISSCKNLENWKLSVESTYIVYSHPLDKRLNYVPFDV